MSELNFEILAGKDVGKLIPIPDDGGTIGRRGTISINDSEAEDFHCQLAPVKGKVIVKDLASSTGTLVNGRGIREAALNIGDVVSVGGTQLVLVRKSPTRENIAANNQSSALKNADGQSLPEVEERHIIALVEQAMETGIEDLHRTMDIIYAQQISLRQSLPAIVMSLLEIDECPLGVAVMNVQSASDAIYVITTRRLLVIGKGEGGAIIKSIWHKDVQGTPNWNRIDAVDLNSQFVKDLGALAAGAKFILTAYASAGLSLIRGITDFREDRFLWTDLKYLDSGKFESFRILIQFESRKFTVQQNQEHNAQVESFTCAYEKRLSEHEQGDISILISALFASAEWEHATGKTIESHELFLSIADSLQQADGQENVVPVEPAPLPQRSVKERLLELKELLDIDAISKDEFEQKKKDILGSL